MNTTKRPLFWLEAFMAVILLLSTGACVSQPATQAVNPLQGTITISGAFAIYPMMQRWDQEFQKLYPNVAFDLSSGGAGKGMTDTLSGAVDIGMISRNITSDEVSKGAYGIPVTIGAVFPEVNTQNPVLQQIMAQGIDQKTMIGIFITGDITTWGQVVGQPAITSEIHVYTRSDSSGAAESWANYLGKSQANLLGIGVSGDPALLDAIAKDPLAIGYNNIGYAFDLTTGKPPAGIAIVPLDVNGNGKADPNEIIETSRDAVNAISTGEYPQPPTQILYLVTKGNPIGLVQTFIRWILTDGQQFVSETGFVPLSQAQLADSLQKVH